MTLNPFFLQGSAGEQFLVQDLINEHLKIYGIDVYYLPRKYLEIDDVLREVETSKFDDNFIIEAYLDNYEGYAPGSDLMTKFGLRLKNEIKLIISSERFEEFISPFLLPLQVIFVAFKTASNAKSGSFTVIEIESLHKFLSVTTTL